MTYSCVLEDISTAISVDLDGTYPEGGGPAYTFVNEVAVLEAPDDGSGNTQAMAMDLKFTQETINISGQFTDGFGDMDWETPGGTRIEKLLALSKIQIDPLVLTWPSDAKSWRCVVTRFTCAEQGGHGETAAYDLSLRIVGAP